MLFVFSEFTQGGQSLACVVVEESAVEPPLGDLIVEGVLFGEPPEESYDIVVAEEFADQLSGELRLPLYADGIELAELVWLGPGVVVV